MGEKNLKYFFTIVDYNYILRGITLFRSFQKIKNKNENFIIITTDNKAFEILKNEPSLNIVNSVELESSELKKIKKSRKINEYCWTLKPIGIDYIFNKFENCKWATYLDSDSMIFKSFSNEYKESYDVILTPHRSKIDYFKKIEEKVGNFNAGFVAIKNSKNGNKILKFWKDKCLEWCSDIPDSKRYADQKYLNEIARKFNKVQTKPSLGLNLAPWNIATKENKLEINKDLIKHLSFYHMQGLKIFNKNIYNLYSDDFLVTNETYKSIYEPYINLLKSTYLEIRQINKSFMIKNEYFLNFKLIIKKLFLGMKNLKIILR